MREPYKTDLTDLQWAAVAPLLPPAKHGGAPRTVDLREVVNTLLYQGVSANTSRTVLCQYIPNRRRATIAPKSDPTGGNLMSKQSVRPSVVKPW
jgi:transposase